MPNRITERRPVDVTYGEQGNFVVEVHEALNDYPTCAGTTALLRVSPRLIDIGIGSHEALAFSRR